MPKVEVDRPENLKAYLFHGVNMAWRAGENDSVGDCPLCGREGKFHVELPTSKFHCFVCGAGGNSTSFLPQLWQCSYDGTDFTQYQAFAEERGLLRPETLTGWEVCRSAVTGEWLVPGYNADRKLCNLYRYCTTSRKRLLLGTPGVKHGMFLATDFDPARPVMYVCEGPWDAMDFWEALGVAKVHEEAYVPTANRESSLAADANVVGVPGVQTFLESWLELFRGKRVTLLYDNDHPRVHPGTGQTVPATGLTATQRVAGILAGVAAEVRWLRWGSAGYDPALPSGYDCRDHLGQPVTPGVGPLGARVTRLGELLGMVVPCPAEWLKTGRTASRGKGSMPLDDCRTYATLTTAWRKALRWTDGLDRALSCMLATSLSTQMVGDQLWMKIIGPASCGKSTLCEAISTNRDYILAKSTIRGFHSGFGDGEEDCSLVVLVNGKTLVTKDGDTLLQSPNLGQILAEGRDLYDCTSRTHYRNKTSRDYAGIRMTWLLCGTSSLRSIDQSELGERFLDCVVMDGIDDELEDEILWRVANRADRNLCIEANGKPETHQEPEMTSVMRMTGGYVGFLRTHAAQLLATAVIPDDAKRCCARLGKFVAYMRARPSKRQDEASEREFAARLVSQLIRLAKCTAVVMNRAEVDAETMRRVRCVALDTARGQTLQIARVLLGSAGLEVKALALKTGLPEDKLRVLLRFMRQIGITQWTEDKDKRRHILTKRLSRLLREVLTEEVQHAD